MNEKLNEIKQWFDHLPPAGKVAVVGAAAIVPLALWKKSHQSGAASTVSAEDYNGLLSDLPSGGASSSSGGGEDSGKAINSNLIAENESLTNKITDIMESFQTYRQDSKSLLAEATAAQMAAANEASFLSGLVGTNIYMDSDSDSKQFSSIFGNVSRAVSEGTISKENANYALSAIAGLGNNGRRPDGTPETGYIMPTSKAEITSEIARTKLVTQNRENAGLDTSLQTKYLQQLTIAPNTPPKSTNGANSSSPVTQVVSTPSSIATSFVQANVSVANAISSISGGNRDRGSTPSSTPSRDSTRSSLSDRIAEKRSRL